MYLLSYRDNAVHVYSNITLEINNRIIKLMSVGHDTVNTMVTHNNNIISSIYMLLEKLQIKSVVRSVGWGGCGCECGWESGYGMA